MKWLRGRLVGEAILEDWRGSRLGKWFRDRSRHVTVAIGIVTLLGQAYLWVHLYKLNSRMFLPAAAAAVAFVVVLRVVQTIRARRK